MTSPNGYFFLKIIEGLFLAALSGDWRIEEERKCGRGEQKVV